MTLQDIACDLAFGVLSTSVGMEIKKTKPKPNHLKIQFQFDFGF